MHFNGQYVPFAQKVGLVCLKQEAISSMEQKEYVR